MAHLTQIRLPSLDLIERLSKNPIGAPFAESLIEILKILYKEEEAKIGANFPLHTTTTEKLAKKQKKTLKNRENLTPPPKNTGEKFMKIAREKGKL